MKSKILLAAAVSVALLAGCSDDDDETINNYFPGTATEVTIASFNVSFDRFTYKDLEDEMSLTVAEQDALIAKWDENMLGDSDPDHVKAEKIIQIRNIATIIQKQRPAILLLAEFNNDGTGEDMTAIDGFRTNYLSIGQKFEGERLEPIMFPYAQSYSTNTGLQSGMDLDNDGKANTAGDGWGFGEYHGRYAFGLLSRYVIDTENTRTFQKFLWKDMPGEVNIDINCDPTTPPDQWDDRKWCTEPDATTWYNDDEWNVMRLSSKNHVDVPITIPVIDGEETVHLLLSHPTPPVFDKEEEAPFNKDRNRAEIAFWSDYISGNSNYMTDDNGMAGGLAHGERFVVMGDLNADPENGDGHPEGISDLLNHPQVNQAATTGAFIPRSFGGPDCYQTGECDRPNTDPSSITNDFGLRVDYVMPSMGLNVVDSGIFWPATHEPGRHLVNDELLGNYGDGKDVSSDHRMVWVKVQL